MSLEEVGEEEMLAIVRHVFKCFSRLLYPNMSDTAY
jgi:hypothetical protein